MELDKLLELLKSKFGEFSSEQELLEKLNETQEVVDDKKDDKAIELVKLTRKLDKLQEDTKNKDKAIKDMEEAIRKTNDEKVSLMKHIELDKILSNKQLFDKNLVKMTMLENIKLTDKGKLEFFDGDVPLSIQEGVETMLEKNPNWIVNSNGGSGSMGSKGSQIITKGMLQSMSQEEYNKIAPDLLSGKIILGD
jgi:hypothetical protein